jgi:hypothetical protein
MNLAWVVVGIGAVVVFARRMARLHVRSGEPDLGFVSHRWIAEHRHSQTFDQHQ